MGKIFQVVDKRKRMAGVVLGMFSGMVGAQADGSAKEDTTAFDTVVVTGARSGGRRTVLDSSSPVDVLSGDDLRKTGKQNLKDALVALAPSFANSPGGARGQQGAAVKTAGLRGLGPGETLVLINGKRRHGMAITFIPGRPQSGQSPADLDLIPTSAVQRVEILRDGASAQYGSDAIAGVINIILKSNDSGGSASVSYGQNADGVGHIDNYGKSKRLLLNQGLKLGAEGALSLSAELDETDSWNAFGPEASNIYYTLPGGALDPREGGDRYRQLNGGPESRKGAFAYNLRLPTSIADLYSFATYSRRKSAGPGAYRGANSSQNLVSIYPDGYLPMNNIKEEDFQVVFGGAGELAQGWNLNVSSSFSQNDAQFDHSDSLSPSFGGATPQSPVHGYTAPPTALNLGRLIFQQWTNNADFSGSVATGLFEQPLGASFGLEYRKEFYEVRPGEYASYADGGYVFPAGHPRAGQRPSPGASGTGGYSPEQAVDASRNVSAVYVDFSQKLGERLELGLAGRLESYSDVGSSNSGKLSGRYKLSDQYAFRTTVNNGFKAPTLQQLYYSQASAIWGKLATTGKQGINSNIYSNPSNPFAVAMGAAPLTPQKSLNYSFGFTGKPSRDLDFSIDFYQISLKDRIVYQSSGNSLVTSKILSAAGLINVQDGWEYTVSYLTNGVDTKTQGIDLVVNYRTDFGPYGNVKWTLLSAQNRTSIERVRSVPGNLQGLLTQSDFFSRSSLGVYTDLEPKNKTYLTADWTLGRLDIRPTLKRYSKVVTKHDTDPARDHVVDSAWITDLEIGYRPDANTRVSVGGTNIFGKRPEGSSAAQQPYNNQLEPSYAVFSPYGAWGAYFYAKLDRSW